MRAAIAILAACLPLLAAGCAAPPKSAYSSAGAGPAVASVPLGSNAAAEPCTQSELEPGREYAIYCGTWKQPSALLRRGEPAAEPQLIALATTGPWRQSLDGRLECGAPSPATILSGPALLLRCTRRQVGFAQSAFVALVDGRAWYADGVPAASPVIERALALDSGRTTASGLGTVRESPGLAAERLASRVASSNDLASYDDLQRRAVEANLAGAYASAEFAYRSMATMQRRLLAADNPALAHAVALQALQVSNQGRYRQATAMLAGAEQQVQRSGTGGIPLAEIWHYQGLNLLNQNRPREAIVLLRRAEAAYQTLAPDSADAAAPGNDLIPPDRNTSAAAWGVVETRRAQAVALRLLGQFQQSAEEAHSATRVLAAYGLYSHKASARLSRTEAVMLQAAGHEDAGLAEMRLATDRFGNALPGTRAYAQTQLLLADRLAQHNQPGEAAQTCRDAGQVLRGAQAGVDAEALQPCLAVLAHATAGGDQAAAREMFLLAEQAQGSTTSQQIALVSARLAESARDPKVGALIRDRDDINRTLADLYGRREDESGRAGGEHASADTARQIAEAEHKRDSLEQAMQSASPNYGQLVQQAVSAEDIFGALRPKEAFAAIVLGQHAGYDFLFYDGHLTVVPIEGGAAMVDPLVARIRASMDAATNDVQPFDTAAASDLYRALFGQAQGTLAQATALSVAPSGTLLSIPFALLLTGPADASRLADAPWLIRKLVVAHVPAPASFVKLRQVAGTSHASRPWFGFGDFRPVTREQAASSFPPATCRDSAALLAHLPLLAGARTELALARAQLGAGPEDELLGAQFTSPAVQTAALKDYRLLHFATHALLQTDLACQPEPALVTSAPPGAPDAAGALLTESEIMGMKLDADGVLLSACNTGGPGGGAAGESLSGLARSFFYAGARSLLVTHWDVNDRVTSVLVGATLAYNKADPSLGMAAALATAQRRLLDRARDVPNLAHPFFWAPLALIGEGRATVSTRVAARG